MRCGSSSDLEGLWRQRTSSCKQMQSVMGMGTVLGIDSVPRECDERFNPVREGRKGFP